MNWRKLLFPFNPLYYTISFIRNKAFDLGLLKSESFDLAVIAVGNLSTGGTGKTPMTAWLLNKFGNKDSLLLSRGYGRKSKGFIELNSKSTALEVGDEPLELYHQNTEIKAVVCESRVEGIRKSRSLYPNLSKVILDDAYQHRSLKAGFYILLTSYYKPYFKDIILPSGDLRESRNGANRADVVVVSKCPNFDKIDKLEWRNNLGLKDHQELIFTRISYHQPVLFNSTKVIELQSEIIFISGLADSSLAYKELSQNYRVIKHFDFPDHHNFSKQDIQSIESVLESNTALKIITTSKDKQRLEPLLSSESLKKAYEVKIGLEFFEEDEKVLENKVGSFLKQYSN